MKKKIVLSLTLMLSLVMMSLTAFAAEEEVSVNKSSAKKGDEVVVTVSLGNEDASVSADVVTDGLEVVSVADSLNMCSAEKVNLASFGNGATVTYTCKVVGDGKEATFKLTNIARGTGIEAPVPTGEEKNVVVTIEGTVAPTDPADPTNPAEPTDPAEPTNPAEPTKPADPTKPAEPTKPADPTKPVSNGNLDKAPNTGDTTASVWPLVLIGCMGVAAAVVAGKKLAYRK